MPRSRVSAAGAVAQALLVLLAGETFAGTWITLFVVLWGIGMLFPATMSLGRPLGRAAPGAASALLGGLRFALGAPARTAAALVALVRPWRGHGEVA
ncbi:MFS transporter [Actinomadura algeriensis]|uniref:DHA1 family bicyclomycin/chloramphenicol resistance-like MFS transporter n=1 Tax=Actinomadura algeriensis TaxID=1679523 RepID=A0ABR9JSR3_9ACTN|nr:hypothetical protein [Actinomadura algeriensis]MBE1533614.1 DHA1 family bicyclomycin/chloramphenicol resistance-like MFS transporter [Actinomadura algeriensis]